MAELLSQRVSKPKSTQARKGGEPAATPAPERTKRLDRDAILDTATAVIGNEGIAALTLRRVGAELGVDHTAIYRYCGNKDAMLGALADRMFLTAPELDPATSWQQRLRVHAQHAFARYQTHPDLGFLIVSQPYARLGLIQGRERALELLTEAGLSLEQAARMSHLIENHIAGCGLFFAMESRDADSTGPEYRAGLRRAYAMVDAAQLPLVAGAAQHLFPDPSEMFDEGLEVLIGEVERRSARDDQAD
jgi:TetR/AcrR family transcriptional regulator, tetracycline repressor protein